MKLEYFHETDTLNIDLNENKSIESKEISDGIVLDYDETGKLTGIEIDNAGKFVNLSKLEIISLPVRDFTMV